MFSELLFGTNQAGIKWSSPPPQLLLPLPACGEEGKRKEDRKESPGVRCLCSGQLMREIFLSFLKEGKSCS